MINSQAFWDTTQCLLENKCWSFREVCCLHLQGLSYGNWRQKQQAPPKRRLLFTRRLESSTPLWAPQIMYILRTYLRNEMCWNWGLCNTKQNTKQNVSPYIVDASRHGRHARCWDPLISRPMGDRRVRVQFWTETVLFPTFSRQTAYPWGHKENLPQTKAGDI